ncbi:hypothetical protein D3C85_797700 [compost metagenome]
MRVLANLGRDLARQGADFLDVFARHPKLHRVTHRRAVLQARDTRTQAGELFIECVDQPAAQRLPVLDALGQHHELGKTRRG